MSYHRNHRNRNSENAAYIHVQKDAVKTVSWNAPPRGRPTNGSYNRADINKEPKFNLCSGEALYLEKFLTPVCGLQGPANLNCYRLPSSFSRPVTTLTPQKTRKRICPCAGMHGIKRILEKNMLGADGLALALPRVLSHTTNCTLSPLGSSVSLWRIVFGWLTFPCCTNCICSIISFRLVPWCFFRPS